VLISLIFRLIFYSLNLQKTTAFFEAGYKCTEKSAICKNIF
jgi:hypothetical protein